MAPFHFPPHTTINRIGARIRDILGDAAHYLSPDDFVFRRILRDCDALMKVDPIQGHLATAMALQLSGDEQGVRRHFANARRLTPDPDGQIAHLWAQATANLGLFSESHRALAESLTAQSGFFPYRAGLAVTVGAFHLLFERLHEALSKNIAMLYGLPLEKAYQALAALDREPASDEDVAAMLDVAGEVLRDRKMFYLDHGPRWKVLTEAGIHMVHFVFRVQGDPEKVADMNYELAMRTAERIDRIALTFHVSFTGAGSSPGRQDQAGAVQLA